jgi:hypothetical protein
MAKTLSILIMFRETDRLIIPCIGMVALASLLVQPAISQESRVLDGSPSQLLLSGNTSEKARAAIVKLQKADFRLFYCDDAILSRRTEAKLVLLDNFRSSREIVIDKSATVRSVLQKGGLADLWKNSWQPQCRLITKDAIYQSPAWSDQHRTDIFLARSIEPADILVVSMVNE